MITNYRGAFKGEEVFVIPISFIRALFKDNWKIFIPNLITTSDNECLMMAIIHILSTALIDTLATTKKGTVMKSLGSILAVAINVLGVAYDELEMMIIDEFLCLAL